MNCRLAQDIDVEAFLLEPMAEEQAAFRSHYADCPDCSAAVAGWSAFDLAVRSMPTPEGFTTEAHPSLMHLEQLVDSPNSQAGEDIMTRKHLSRCGKCQTELNLLTRFDPTRMPGLMAAAAGSPLEPISVPALPGSSILESIRRFVESWNEGLILRPAVIGAFAVAVVAVVGIRMSGGLGGGAEPPVGEIRIAEKSLPPVLKDSFPSARTSAADVPDAVESDGAFARLGGTDVDRGGVQRMDEPSMIDPGDVVRPSVPTPPKPRLIAHMNTRPDSTSRVVDSSSPPPQARASFAPTVDPKASVVREEILLAALTDLPLPTYGAPPGADSVGWTQQFGAVRGRGSASLASRAPDHVGLTLSSAPTLWWTLDAYSELPIQISVVDDEAIEPLLRIDLAGPHLAGLHSISLAEHGIELQTDVEYRWFVTMLVDPDRPSRNPVSGGAIRVVSEADSRRNAVRSSTTAERGHLLAKLGLWYDAYDFFAALSAAHPEVGSLTRHRERMMELARSDP
jgi:hypothetical protein